MLCDRARLVRGSGSLVHTAVNIADRRHGTRGRTATEINRVRVRILRMIAVHTGRRPLGSIEVASSEQPPWAKEKNQLSETAVREENSVGSQFPVRQNTSAGAVRERGGDRLASF